VVHFHSAFSFTLFCIFVLSRYTSCVQVIMKRALPLLAFLFLLPFGLFAQDHAISVAPPSASAAQLSYGTKLRVNGIHNAGKISDALYRGGQPQEQGLAELKKLGISTIVDLRGDGPDRIAWERRTAESLGMRFVHIPVSGWAAPTEEQVGQFLSLFRSDTPQKVFVHCRFGEDRTGVFVATYRMALEKWNPEQAMKEMYFFNFNGFWHPSMKAFIREFPNRLKSSPSLASLLAQATPH
jgi:tyrosine-protein phosphatase SIW14